MWVYSFWCRRCRLKADKLAKKITTPPLAPWISCIVYLGCANVLVVIAAAIMHTTAWIFGAIWFVELSFLALMVIWAHVMRRKTPTDLVYSITRAPIHYIADLLFYVRVFNRHNTIEALEEAKKRIERDNDRWAKRIGNL